MILERMGKLPLEVCLFMLQCAHELALHVPARFCAWQLVRVHVSQLSDLACSHQVSDAASPGPFPWPLVAFASLPRATSAELPARSVRAATVAATAAHGAAGAQPLAAASGGGCHGHGVGGASFEATKESTIFSLSKPDPCND